MTKYCPESSSHGEVLVAAADLVCVRCGLLRRLRSRRACVIESRTVGGRRMKRTPACSERWKVCLTVCTQFRSPSLHSLGRDGSAPLRPEAQTCPQTRSLGGLPSCSQQSSGGVYGPFWCQAPDANREHSILLTFCRIAPERSST